MDIDERFMWIALDLARRGRGSTSPNPMVGAVVVRDGKIVGTGYHQPREGRMQRWPPCGRPVKRPAARCFT